MLQDYFQRFRNQVIGIDAQFESPYGTKKIVYADWTASGRAYGPIEERLQHDILPLLANTHTETTVTGTAMTRAYEQAKHIIKQHVHAGADDVLIFAGSGMTGAVNKLQRLLGLRIPERIMDYVKPGALPTPEELRNSPVRIHELFSQYLDIDPLRKPIVFVSHMEHHSNQTSWLETIADVEIIPNDADGNIDLHAFEELLQRHQDRQNKIAAITGCSNVTGIQTPYHEVAKRVHRYGGLCFVDFACSAPYVQIDMHPGEEGADLDAIFFSPHKFLGGQGTPGVLIFHKKLYHNLIPDQPGGGTVTYTNPWKYHEYITDIEHREDGGTPPFLQGIKAALAVKLKEEMGVDKMLQREEELLRIIFQRLPHIPGVEILEGQNTHRLGVISFIIHGTHFNLVVKLLNDRFGIQTRGGCACAGTYGHMLLQVDELHSYEILGELHKGDLSCKPGWVRMSIHPVMTDEEVTCILDAIEQVALHYADWKKDYVYDPQTNEYHHATAADQAAAAVNRWFETPLL
ncbi:MAG TPA: aminotransferase class V-fold PLP-dependent enzyme [Lacibacter sp.]|nr:aminotransferase class V-fold PLP-dependent enzyme [Lacibacter sp.]HMO88557.1 aminotransferase class V-fold PLP-dependent enzyme [Lacibacter sp.]HMP86028.1 aminotransferase class V-fold PLP-dependent enzyme [Lacibacter sp.]